MSDPMSTWGATSEDRIVVFVTEPTHGTLVTASRKRRWWEFWRA